MKTLILLLTFMSFNQLHAQIEGTYTSLYPKRCVVTLDLNSDATCNCILDYPNDGVQESYTGQWKLKGNKLSIYIQKYNSKWIKVSSYKIVEKDGQTIAKGTSPWKRIRIFKKKKYWLMKQ